MPDILTKSEVDAIQACNGLREQFGDDLGETPFLAFADSVWATAARRVAIRQVNDADFALFGQIKPEPKTKLKTSDKYPLFFKFFYLYPEHRRISIPACLGIWKRKKLEKIGDKVISALQEYVESEGWMKDSGMFVPSAVKWLSEERYTAGAGKASDPIPQPSAAVLDLL